MNKGLNINNLYIFLRVFNNKNIICRHDVFHKSGLAVSTISSCLDICIQGEFIQGAGSNGDLRRQNYKLTAKGQSMLSLLQGALKYEVQT